MVTYFAWSLIIGSWVSLAGAGERGANIAVPRVQEINQTLVGARCAHGQVYGWEREGEQYRLCAYQTDGSRQWAAPCAYLCRTMSYIAREEGDDRTLFMQSDSNMLIGLDSSTGSITQGIKQLEHPERVPINLFALPGGTIAQIYRHTMIFTGKNGRSRHVPLNREIEYHYSWRVGNAVIYRPHQSASEDSAQLVRVDAQGAVRTIPLNELSWADTIKAVIGSDDALWYMTLADYPHLQITGRDMANGKLLGTMGIADEMVHLPISNPDQFGAPWVYSERLRKLFVVTQQWLWALHTDADRERSSILAWKVKHEGQINHIVLDPEERVLYAANSSDPGALITFDPLTGQQRTAHRLKSDYRLVGYMGDTLYVQRS